MTLSLRRIMIMTMKAHSPFWKSNSVLHELVAAVIPILSIPKTLTLVTYIFITCTTTVTAGASKAPMARAVWILGDSLADVGNNNYLPSAARSNFPPNGIDYPAGPTGRFCNGVTVPDVLTTLLGFSTSPPPYLQPDIVTGGPGILQGVNYASAAGGILNDTGKNYIYDLEMDTQLAYFQNTITSLQRELGSSQAVRELLADSLFIIIIGSNDYLNNYLLPLSIRSNLSAPTYRNLLISNLRRQLTTLYALGGRKFVVAGVGPMGCIPSLLFQRNSDGTCIDSINQLIVDFNAAVHALVNDLTSQLLGSTFLYANVYDFLINIVNNPGRFGFRVTNKACCGGGPFNGFIPCAAFLGASVCSNHSEYIFWDPFHPTEAFNLLLGRALFSGGPPDISPINIRALFS